MLEQAIALPPRLADMLGAKTAPRALVEAIVEQLVDTLDAVDGDSDFEEIDAEDSFVLSPIALRFADRGPGCTISDPDKGVDDDGEAVNEDGYGDLSPLAPRYGVDQSTGPVNEQEGYRAWQRAQS